MSVELVATRESTNLRLKNYPVLMKESADGTIEVDDSIPGGRHCLLSVVQGQLVVWDLGTEGGTFVNGIRVTKAALHTGDTLSLGETEFQVNTRQYSSRRYLFGPRS